MDAHETELVDEKRLAREKGGRGEQCDVCTNSRRCKAPACPRGLDQDHPRSESCATREKEGDQCIRTHQRCLFRAAYKQWCGAPVHAHSHVAEQLLLLRLLRRERVAERDLSGITARAQIQKGGVRTSQRRVPIGGAGEKVLAVVPHEGVGSDVYGAVTDRVEGAVEIITTRTVVVHGYHHPPADE